VAILATCCRSGHGETLEDAWAIAVAENHRLAAARLEEVAASHELNGATTEWLPTVGLRGAYTIRSDEPTFVVRDPLPGLGAFEFPYAQQNAASAAAEVRVPLYTSGRIPNSIRCAKSRHAAAQYYADQARQDLLLAVSEAYVAVVRSERDLEAAKLEFESLEADAADVARLFAEDRVPQCDVLAARAAAAAAKQLCTQQQQALDLARGRYNRLLGRPLSQPVTLEEVTLEQSESTHEELVQIAYERRPDLLALSSIAASHDYASASTRATARPQVTGALGAQYEENRYGNPDSLATAAIIVDWKLYDGGKADLTADAEQMRAASTRRLVDDLKSQIALDLLNACNLEAQAAEQLEVANQRLAHATEHLRVLRLRNSGGMATNSAVLEAQAKWSQAMCDYHNAYYDGVLAQLRIRYLTGSL
jgi:outer membrane protein TolC